MTVAFAVSVGRMQPDPTLGSEKLEHGWRMIEAGIPSVFGLGWRFQLSGFYCTVFQGAWEL